MFRKINNTVAVLLRNKRWAYRQLFLHDGELSPAAKIVLADLKKACHVGGKIQSATDRETFINVGHHEIWEHINGYINLTEPQIHMLSDESFAANSELEDEMYAQP